MEALRWNDVTGALEAGKEADIVVFDTNDFDWRPLHNPVTNLVYGVTGHSVHTVLIAGEVVLDAKRLTKVDEGALREQVEATDRKILRRIGIEPRSVWPTH